MVNAPRFRGDGVKTLQEWIHLRVCVSDYRLGLCWIMISLLPRHVKAMITECAWACVVCCHSTMLWHSIQQFHAKGPNIPAIVSCYHIIKLYQLQHACCLSWGGRQA